VRQSERSKQWLIAALLQLMEKKLFSAITVKDITDKAGVSRLTFYRNFESKEAILQQHYDNVFREYMATLDDIGSTDLEYALTQCYTFWKHHSDLQDILVKNNLHNLMLEPFDRYLQAVLERAGLENRFSHFQKKFIAGGLSSTMMDWIGNDKGVSPADMAKEVLKMTVVN
jgi:AcrR family transcriptional regulator